MARDFYVNLPVKDLKATTEFWSKLGMQFNKTFTDDRSTAMMIDENIIVMLVVEEFFKSFVIKPISDYTNTTEVIISISVDTKEAVDEMIAKVKAAGGDVYKEPYSYDFMYGQGFQDIDGHLWEFVCVFKNNG